MKIKILIAALLVIAFAAIGALIISSNAKSTVDTIDKGTSITEKKETFESERIIEEKVLEEPSSSFIQSKTLNKEPSQEPQASVGGGMNIEDLPAKDPNKDPAQTGNAPVGGGRNIEDGPGELQTEMPTLHDYPEKPVEE